jgi:hypothetical protein
MRHLRATAEKRPLGRSQTHQAKQETTQAGAFLTWLSDRGRTIEHCRQADLDRLAHREAGRPAPSPDLPPLVHEDGPDARPHASAPGHHPGPGATAPAPPARHAPTGPQRRLLASAESRRCRIPPAPARLPACPTPTAEVPDDSSPADSQGSR